MALSSPGSGRALRPFEGLLVTVVTPRQLYIMKKDTVRPKDRMDAEALRRKFGLEDE